MMDMIFCFNERIKIAKQPNLSSILNPRVALKFNWISLINCTSALPQAEEILVWYFWPSGDLLREFYFRLLRSVPPLQRKKRVGHFWRVELASFWKWIMIMYACHQVFFIINSMLCVAQRRELQFSVQSNRYCAVIMGNLSHGKV